MQHELHFDQNAGVIFVRYGEKLNKDIIIAASKDVNALVGLRPDIPVFVDFRDCIDINLSSDDTRHIASYMALNKVKRGSFRIAQLVSTKVMYGVSRMTAPTIDENMVEIRTFEEMTPALEWVGLPADYKLPYTSTL
ncbi:MAG: hypothetical protein V7750_04455 [Sneathiella sp.]